MKKSDITQQSLYAALESVAERDKLRLHTPGHKGRLCEVDLTELTDDSFPSDRVSAAEKNTACVYGVKHARFLCGGSSQGVKASVFYADCDAVVDVNSHRSVFDGFLLSGKRHVTAGERGGIYPLTVKQIADAVAPRTKAVVVTTPTYYGYCADADGIADYCKKRGLLFIADSAHGAHFGFGDRLPESVAPHCDICNVSTHKTLSALTQSALLLDNLDDADGKRLYDVTDVMGTTSPSYPLYASIDYAVRKAATAETRAAYDALYAPTEQLKSEFPFLDNDDFTRLVLDCEKLGVRANKLNGALVRRKVYSEKVDEKRIVFILTAENTPADVVAFRTALATSISEIR